MAKLSRSLLSRLALVAALSVSASAAFAQATTNPLRPASNKAAPAATAPAPAPAATAPAAPAAEAPKGKRARSEAQLANDRRMKACGAEWRANKEALTKQGKTWRTYMPECNARLKAAGQ